MIPADSVPRRLELSGLGGHVSVREVDAFYRANRTPYGRRWWVIAAIVVGYLTGQMILIAAIVPIGVYDERMQRTVTAAIALITGAYAAALMAVIWRNVARVVRIDRTARANGLAYNDRAPLAVFSGTPLQRPGRQEVSDVLRPAASAPSRRAIIEQDAAPHAAPVDVSGTAAPTPFILATFAASPGLISRRAGVAEIVLERAVPNIVLENRRAGIMRRRGDRFRPQQRLRLEGDFDRTFALYCPTGYERDALYIFTPDLMALLLDLAPDCEVELVGDRLVLYSGSPWRLWKAARFARVVTMVDAIAAKVRRQTALYGDERSAATGVIAAGGRRLRARPSAGSVIAIALPLGLAFYGLVDLVTP